MNNFGQGQQIDFTVDQSNLFREESITDLKVASIRRLVPIKIDGTEDQTRAPIFVGHTQIMSPEGPLPIQAKLPANNLEEAMDEFPKAMEKALAELVEQIKNIQKQKQTKQNDASRIIVPGR